MNAKLFLINVNCISTPPKTLLFLCSACEACGSKFSVPNDANWTVQTRRSCNLRRLGYFLCLFVLFSICTDLIDSFLFDRLVVSD